MIRIGLLASTSLTDFNLETIKPVTEDKNFVVALVIIDIRPKLTLKQKIRKNFKRGRGGYMLIMAVQSYFNKKKPTYDTKSYCVEHSIDFIETAKPYAPETIEKLKHYNLDLLALTGGFGIIKEPMLKLTPMGVLSYHHGNMRTYRGMPPAFWELYHHEKEMGVTVQLLSSGLDCGVPVEEKTIRIDAKDSLETLRERAMDESVDMLYKAMKKLSSEDFVPQRIEKFGKIYTLPNLSQWLVFKLKLFSRKIMRR